MALQTGTGGLYPVTLPGGFPNVAAVAWTPPTIAGFHLVSPQTGGCDAVGCTGNINGTISLTPGRPNMFWETILRSYLFIFLYFLFSLLSFFFFFGIAIELVHLTHLTPPHRSSAATGTVLISTSTVSAATGKADFNTDTAQNVIY